MMRQDSEPLVWTVGALCLAIADTLNQRFNPVAVKGEISGFTRAASGHCYFSLKDETGQIRCAMFKRAASALGFMPREGDKVEVRGRLGVYEARGDLQLIVESLQKAGQGDLFAQFLKLKATLEAEGLFEAARKQAIPSQPRAIGLITSLGAAALHDVATALQRRVPHIPVILASASVQGANAPAELVRSLQQLQVWQGQSSQVNSAEGAPTNAQVDVILIVRGGGSMEDLWAFNDEALVRAIAACPIPVVSGVGHETDFTLTDFVADLRAPTPTAAAELVAVDSAQWLASLDAIEEALTDALGLIGWRLDWVVLQVASVIKSLSSCGCRSLCNLALNLKCNSNIRRFKDGRMLSLKP
jgi:exodeoxyribonuclease VII large subunit